MPVTFKALPKTISKAQPKVTPPYAPSSDAHDILSIRSGHCPSLKGLSRLSYELGGASDDAILLRITDTSGSGHFSDQGASRDLKNCLCKLTPPLVF